MISRLLLQRAFRRGVLGGSRLWTVIGSVGIAVRLLRKMARDEPEVAFSERLEPGETLVISHDRGARVVRPRR